jgi:hypothetical protein
MRLPDRSVQRARADIQPPNEPYAPVPIRPAAASSRERASQRHDDGVTIERSSPPVPLSMAANARPRLSPTLGRAAAAREHGDGMGDLRHVEHAVSTRGSRTHAHPHGTGTPCAPPTRIPCSRAIVIIHISSRLNSHGARLASPHFGTCSIPVEKAGGFGIDSSRGWPSRRGAT